MNDGGDRPETTRDPLNWPCIFPPENTLYLPRYFRHVMLQWCFYGETLLDRLAFCASCVWLCQIVFVFEKTKKVTNENTFLVYSGIVKISVKYAKWLPCPGCQAGRGDDAPLNPPLPTESYCSTARVCTRRLSTCLTRWRYNAQQLGAMRVNCANINIVRAKSPLPVRTPDIVCVCVWCVQSKNSKYNLKLNYSKK